MNSFGTLARDMLVNTIVLMGVREVIVHKKRKELIKEIETNTDLFERHASMKLRESIKD